MNSIKEQIENGVVGIVEKYARIAALEMGMSDDDPEDSTGSFHEYFSDYKEHILEDIRDLMENE